MELEQLKHLTPEAVLEIINTQASNIATLETAAEAKNAECEYHSTIIKEQTEQIELLNGIIGNAKPAQTTIEAAGKKAGPPVIPTELVEIGDKKYQWQRAAFRLPGDINKYSAQEAATNTEVLTRLLAIEGQSILKELE